MDIIMDYTKDCFEKRNNRNFTNGYSKAPTIHQFINSTSQPGLPYFATIFLMPYDENFWALKNTNLPNKGPSMIPQSLPGS